MPLLERFRQFVEDQNLYHPGERVLLAVSGGIDSVTLSDLAQQAGWEVAIAHCNFQLRGPASDGDEDFVRDLAEEWDLPLFVEFFDTRLVAESRGISIQMAARELRYEWLEQLRRREGFDRIATAHHLDDSIETILLNFAKGTGLRGLHGIPEQRGAIIRPLLFATKHDILRYVVERGLSYREDASNKSENYERNKIRHRIVPVLHELNPAFEQTAAANLDRFRQSEYLFDYALDHIKQEVWTEEEGRITIDLEGLLHHYRAAPTLLYEWLRPYHFHPAQVDQILQSTTRQPGALFFSSTHQLLVDRETLMIEARILDTEEKQYHIAEGIETVYLPDGKLTLQFEEGQPVAFSPNPNQALLDANLLDFPLRLRHWHAGDYFYPLGMQGKRQKLQDFFTNNKIPRLDKNRIWILETSHGDICWIVGHRVDERFKITSQTDRYLRLIFLGA